MRLRSPGLGDKSTATALGHTVNATTEVHPYVQEGASIFKSLKLKPGSIPYKNIQDALFQATGGHSVNSFIIFSFFVQ